MFARLSRIANPRDVLLFAGLGVVTFVFTAVWAVMLYQISIPFVPQTYFLTFILIVLSAVAALLPRFTWGSADTRPRAAFMIRFGLALQIFGLLMTPVGLYFETDPSRSVPIGFAAFTGMLLGIFVAGFGGNMVAPKRA